MTDVMTLSMRIAEEIQVLLVRKRMNQKQLAQAIGVSAMWVSGRLTGQTEIAVNDLPRIADALGVPVSRLLPNDVRGESGQTPYSVRLTDRPRDGRPPNRRNQPNAPKTGSRTSDDDRRPARRTTGPAVSRPRRGA